MAETFLKQLINYIKAILLLIFLRNPLFVDRNRIYSKTQTELYIPCKTEERIYANGHPPIF